MLQGNTTPTQKERVQFKNVSRLFDLERQRRANRCAHAEGWWTQIMFVYLFIVSVTLNFGLCRLRKQAEVVCRFFINIEAS